MRTIDRLNLIIRADINELLAHAENPAKLLPQIISDMESASLDAQAKVAEQIAQLTLIETDLKTAKQDEANWQANAELAVKKERDDLAIEALNRKNDYAAQVAIYQKMYDTQDTAVKKLRLQLSDLMSKLGSAKRNKDMLIAQAKRTDARKDMAQISAKLDQNGLESAYARMAKKVKEDAARVDAMEEVKTSSVDEEFKKLEQDAAQGALSKELADLKQKLGKS